MLRDRSSLTKLILGTLFLISILFAGLAATALAQGGTPRFGGEIRIAVYAELSNLDRIFAPTSIAIGVPQRLIFDGLAQLDRSTMEYEPRLAESWEILDDNLRLRFHLREGVNFHNGDPFTAHDVKFTFDIARLPEYASPYTARFSAVQDVVVVDDHTVDLILKSAVLPSLQSDVWEHPIYPKAVYEQDVQGFGLNPVGLGPYQILEHRRGLDMTLVANEDYYLGRPYLDRVVVKIVPEDQARVLAIEANEIDVDIQLSVDDISRLSGQPEYNLFPTGATNVQIFGFFYEHPIVGGHENRGIRQAIAHAINEESISALYESAGGVPTVNMLPPIIWSYNENSPSYPYDPERALQLLAEAGWTRGSDGMLRNAAGELLSLELLTDSDSPDLVDQAQIIQENLRDIGIDLTIVAYEFNTYFEYMRTGNYDVRVARRNGIIDPNFLFTYFHSSNIPAQNRNWYVNPRVDELLEFGRVAFDSEARFAAYTEVQEILATDLPNYPILAVPVWVAARSNFVWPDNMVLTHVSDTINYIPKVYLR